MQCTLQNSVEYRTARLSDQSDRVTTRLESHMIIGSKPGLWDLKPMIMSLKSRILEINIKLDGVSPVDNRPSTNKLHHFVKQKKITCDMWHMTFETWHVTCDMWHVTCDLFWGVNILSKFQLPSSYCLWFMILWRSGGKCSLTYWLTQLIMRLFIEQPRLLRVC